ncbi:hypothetical protein DFJ74DRAFT_661445 [Hyaloraphidium curvatum]|nr:hypothetical protein DFJ74DRAFT_661445 [Hyaloraphidium curvatum]
MVAKLLVWSHVAAGTWVMTIHMQSPESWRCGLPAWVRPMATGLTFSPPPFPGFTCFMFPIIVGAQKSLATLAVRGMPEDLYHVIRFESHFLASLLYRLLFFVVRTTWTFIWVLFVEIVYKIFSIGIVYIPLVEEWRSHRYITWLFPAPERDPERRKRTIEEGFFYLQGADICTCLGVWILRAATGHIPTMSPEGDMQLKFNIMFLIQLLVELAIVPIYYFFARGVLKVKDFDPLTTGYAYLSRYQVQMTVFALACYQINLGMLAMGL